MPCIVPLEAAHLCPDCRVIFSGARCPLCACSEVHTLPLAPVLDRNIAECVTTTPLTQGAENHGSQS